MMPGPDPFGLSYEENEHGRPVVIAEMWTSRLPPFTGCPRTRLARARAVLANLKRDGWTCPRCGRPVPLYRRADAVYCSTGCRKRAMRERKA
ncbi:hypothetical protein CN97_00150 [Haematobacter massiliensis]|uniref:Uncharacterized protein n=2 Tax=Haematobacter massiliensis TaxID=195105 RepID=A0A086Y0G3_9RHOB|nr:hypothetical protein [Haematobacter massiliensis]KFI27763.1 hypothetical protein CN97_00150 [Haematobacter massiliensis]QBJ24016.1 hypothetical protein HmaOT1_06945 [Haematobacter massiliensis]